MMHVATQCSSSIDMPKGSPQMFDDQILAQKLATHAKVLTINNKCQLPTL
jgi:hypothetical protein